MVRIAIVDDDHRNGIGDLLVATLRGSPYRIFMICDQDVAFGRIEELLEADAILLDQQNKKGRVQGLEIALALQRLQSKAVIIGMSAGVPEPEFCEATTEFLGKPFSPADLLRKLDSFFVAKS